MQKIDRWKLGFNRCALGSGMLLVARDRRSSLHLHSPSFRIKMALNNQLQKKYEIWSSPKETTLVKNYDEPFKGRWLDCGFFCAYRKIEQMKCEVVEKLWKFKMLTYDLIVQNIIHINKLMCCYTFKYSRSNKCLKEQFLVCMKIRSLVIAFHLVLFSKLT